MCAAHKLGYAELDARTSSQLPALRRNRYQPWRTDLFVLPSAARTTAAGARLWSARSAGLRSARSAGLRSARSAGLSAECRAQSVWRRISAATAISATGLQPLWPTARLRASWLWTAIPCARVWAAAVSTVRRRRIELGKFLEHPLDHPFGDRARRPLGGSVRRLHRRDALSIAAITPHGLRSACIKQTTFIAAKMSRGVA